MSEHPPQIFEPITTEALVARARLMRQEGYRLVQIGATRLPEHLELTYSFDRDGQLHNLRLHVPAAEPQVPSLSEVYWCAFLYENEMHDLFGLRVVGMALDFHGTFYRTAVKFPFGRTKLPVAKPAPANPGANAPAQAPRNGEHGPQVTNQPSTLAS